MARNAGERQRRVQALQGVEAPGAVLQAVPVFDPWRILGHQHIVLETGQPRPVAVPLLAAVKLRRGGGEHLDQHPGIEQHILILVVILPLPTDDHEVRVRPQSRAGVRLGRA